MWLMCILQYGINVGWVFLVTWLPKYLKDVKQLDATVGGLMSTIVLMAGVMGMLCGGPLTDLAARRLGKRWGRTLPMAVCYSIAVVAYLACIRLENDVLFFGGGFGHRLRHRLERPVDLGIHARCGWQEHGRLLWLVGNMWATWEPRQRRCWCLSCSSNGTSTRIGTKLSGCSVCGYLAAAICALFLQVKPVSNNSPSANA